MEIVNGEKTLIQIKAGDTFINKLEISTIHDPTFNICVQVEDVPHLHTSSNDSGGEVTVLTHGYDSMIDFMETLKQLKEIECMVKYIVNGGNHIMSRSLEEWHQLCWKYIITYFGLGSMSHIRETIQFPPYRRGCKISELAYLFKKAFLEKVGILTGYNTKEHLMFLNCDENLRQSIGKLENHEKRILIVYPTPLVFFNVRYTDATKYDDVISEIERGENDIKSLIFINKKIIKDENTAFVNVIAAPNLEKSTSLLMCNKCHLLDGEVLRNVNSLIKRFKMILENLNYNGNKWNAEKVTFLKVLGNIFGFMATRKSIRRYVPAFKAQPAEQVRSLMLNVEQLKVLHSDKRKKIILGGFGSGKSLIALYQMEHLNESAEKKTSIFYVYWDANSLMVHDVRKFVETLPKNELSVIYVFNVKDLSEHLKLTAIPSLAQLILELLHNYPGTVIHVFVDEYDAEQLNLFEARKLNSVLKMAKLEEACITILPHSLSKNRTYVSKRTEKPHGNYQFKATGMEIFELTRCMRTTQRIFQLTNAVEKMIGEEKTVFYQPKIAVNDYDDYSVNASKSPLNATKGRREVIVPARLDFVGSDTMSGMTNLHKNVLKKSSSNINRFNFHIPKDIDVVSASVSSMPVDKSTKTVTQYAYPETISVGHNIIGNMPTCLTFSVHSPSHFHEMITKLSIIIGESFFKENMSKLVICNTPLHYFVMKNALKLMDINFIDYIEYSGWQLKDADENVVISPLQKRCMLRLTDYTGSRGDEADQVVVCIEPSACRLKHLTLECMNRSHCDLILIGISYEEAPTAIERSLPIWVQKKWQKHRSMGIFLSQVAQKGLLQMNYCVTFSHKDETICLTKDNRDFRINVASKKYKECMKTLKQRNVIFEDTGSDEHDATAFKMLENTSPVTDLRCVGTGQRECLLTWKSEGFVYIVRKWSDDGGVWIEVGRTRQCYCIFKSLIHDSKYKFSVTAVSNVDSSDCEIDYIHMKTSSIYSYIEELIQDNRVVEMETLVALYPQVVYMRDKDGNTPLMLSAIYNNNPPMVHLLIINGSNSLATDKFGLNSYHMAAMAGNSNALYALCQHNKEWINAQDGRYRTALHYAAMYGHVECVDVLLRCWLISTSIKDENSRNAYDVAGFKHNQHNRSKIRKMIENYNVKQKSLSS
ncbi:uncharacterized protein LOC130625760 [Hydractinia symbiolongicarpus]|uniref:uncharacterized protein LOC130625760 n=1 Tax=Hydractinia symbiolongicarpus TaxID=13093 RepID=UPI00254BB34A|nr:uncharacterized protein LOC130625760 [Hydractinia symbiolongicarpus]